MPPPKRTQIHTPPAAARTLPAKPSAPVRARPQGGGVQAKKSLPVAPPVYRPRATPNALQLKQAKVEPPAPSQARRAPAAPPVYRPQPAPKCLQPKMAAPRPASAPPTTHAAAHAPRHARNVLQRKTAARPARVEPARSPSPARPANAPTVAPRTPAVGAGARVARGAPPSAPRAQRAGVLQAMLEDTHAHLNEYRNAVTNALLAQGQINQQAAAEARRVQEAINRRNALLERGVTQQVATRLVAANPPEDDYEDARGFAARMYDALDAEGFQYRGFELNNIDTALDDYRQQQALLRQQQAQQQQNALALLRDYVTEANQRIAAIKNHVFHAEFNDYKPKGLHAYTNGGLPAQVQALATYGDVNAVHVIIWTHPRCVNDGSRYCKWSTMFPKNMPEGMVCWYLLNRRLGNNFPPNQRPSAEAVAPFSWGNLVVGQSGNTNFPEYAGGEGAVLQLFRNDNALHFAENVEPSTVTVNNITYRLAN